VSSLFCQIFSFQDRIFPQLHISLDLFLPMNHCEPTSIDPGTCSTTILATPKLPSALNELPSFGGRLALSFDAAD